MVNNVSISMNVSIYGVYSKNSIFILFNTKTNLSQHGILDQSILLQSYQM
jgi:phosphoribosylaminoimidazole carboxylase (NCAIR synthetase)